MDSLSSCHPEAKRIEFRMKQKSLKCDHRKVDERSAALIQNLSILRIYIYFKFILQHANPLFLYPFIYIYQSNFYLHEENSYYTKSVRTISISIHIISLFFKSCD